MNSNRSAMNRRAVLAAFAGLACGVAPVAARAHAMGALDARDFGLEPGSPRDQHDRLEALLWRAAEENVPVFLPPGSYLASGVRMPPRAALVGVSGLSRLVLGQGGDSLLSAEDAETIRLDGLVLDGGGRPLGGDFAALVSLRGVRALAIDRCAIIGSGGSGIVCERVGGRIERTGISGAADIGLYSVESDGLHVADNSVGDCGNGGILIHRWQRGPDGSAVTGNRVARIGATAGGTGQNGNGINVYQADHVLVAHNHVADCAFSAIRANGASNLQVIANRCLRSGETAIYSEFAFEGAVIASNIVDGAAIGISIANLDEGGRMAVCQGNIVRNLVDAAPYEAFEAIGFGIGISVEADTTVSGNVIEGAPRFGMLLGWGPYLRNVVATGNVIRASGDGIAVSVVEGTGPAIVADNVIGAEGHAIVGYRWATRATGDLADPDAPVFPGLTIERNRRE